MRCSMCPFLDTCEDDAQLGGGCDCDGADDFGVDPIDDDLYDESLCEIDKESLRLARVFKRKFKKEGK